MYLINWLTLTTRVIDFNLVARRPALLEKLRKLTLSPNSGLNYELDRLLVDTDLRTVNCKVLLAYKFDTLVAWALLSKEGTDFPFVGSLNGFNKEDGWMFQVFVDPDYRRQGIASELYLMAQRYIGDEVICICPWDNASYHFYSNFPGVKHKKL